MLNHGLVNVDLSGLKTDSEYLSENYDINIFITILDDLDLTEL